jgi:hypothetical protein
MDKGFPSSDDFSLDLSYISIVEKEPFCGTESKSAMEHIDAGR